MLSRNEIEVELQKLKDERRHQTANSNEKKQPLSPLLTRSEMEASLNRMRVERQRQAMYYSAAKDQDYRSRFGTILENPMNTDEINERTFQYQMARKTSA